jgi:hypothetical protein
MEIQNPKNPRKRKTTSVDEKPKQKKNSKKKEVVKDVNKVGKQEKKTDELAMLEEEQEEQVVIKPTIVDKQAAVTVILTQPKSFSTLLDVLSDLLSDGVFQIISKDRPDINGTSSTLSIDTCKNDFSGIYAEFIDKSNSCVIIMKYAAEVVLNEELKVQQEDMQFCVHIPTMLNHLKSVNSSFCLQMYRRRNDDKIHFKAFGQSLGYRQFRHIRMDTWDKVADKFSISDIKYDYVVVFELAEMRRILRLAKSINSKNLRIVIMEPKENPDNRVKRSFFLIQVLGEHSYDEEVFCSTTEIAEETTGMQEGQVDNQGEGQEGCQEIKDGDQEEQKKEGLKRLVIKNSEMLEMQDADNPMNYHLKDLNQKYAGIFTVEYLNMFIKSLDRHTINLHLANDKPMIVTCSLGDETSFLAFVLAQQEDNDEVVIKMEAFAVD